jgi:hypothetical protein
MDAAVFINLRDCSEVYKLRKWDIQRLHQVTIPTYQEPTSLKTRARRYEENIERCAFWNFRTDFIAEVKWTYSLVRSPIWANKDLLESKFCALCNGVDLEYTLCSGH